MRKEKVIIYQLFPRLFGNHNNNNKAWGMPSENGCGKFNDINDHALKGLKELGINYIWLTGVIRHSSASAYPEHDLKASNHQILKGNAGSPYAIKDYYDVDPDLADDPGRRMYEFEDLIGRIHKTGFKVIIDFVPNHVARDYKSINIPFDRKDLGEDDNTSLQFSPSNNFYYVPGKSLNLPGNYGNKGFVEYPAKATGNDVFHENPDIHDWYETVKLNYGIDPFSGAGHFDPVPDTWHKMLEILEYWSAKGIDGFRCDMAGMVPVEFWSYAIGRIKQEFPGLVFIAELYETGKYREYIETGGFDYLYDKVGMYDVLRSVIEKNASSQQITGVWQMLEGLDDKMLRFMENHDEQRIASRFFCNDAQKGLPAMVVCTLMNNGPVMIYNGQETGETAEGVTGFSGDDGRTSIFDYCSMPIFQKWTNGGLYDGGKLNGDEKMLRQSYMDILNFACAHKEVQGQFYDLMWQNQDLQENIKNGIFSFLKYTENSILLIVVSFYPDVEKFKIRIPEHALQLAGFEGRSSFSIICLYPDVYQQSLLISQLTGPGIDIELQNSSWTALRIQ